MSHVIILCFEGAVIGLNSRNFRGRKNPIYTVVNHMVNNNNRTARTPAIPFGSPPHILVIIISLPPSFRHTDNGLMTHGRDGTRDYFLWEAHGASVRGGRYPRISYHQLRASFARSSFSPWRCRVWTLQLPINFKVVLPIISSQIPCLGRRVPILPVRIYLGWCCSSPATPPCIPGLWSVWTGSSAILEDPLSLQFYLVFLAELVNPTVLQPSPHTLQHRQRRIPTNIKSALETALQARLCEYSFAHVPVATSLAERLSI